MSLGTIAIEQRPAPVSAARPGRSRSGFCGVTIHETGNYRRSADARSHAAYLAGAGKNNQTSAHYYVDDERAVQCIPEGEVAWHASDGTRAPGGNMSTVCIEICTNWGWLPPEYAGLQKDVKNAAAASEAEKEEAMRRFAKAVDNAALLAAGVLHRNGAKGTAGFLHQHNHWDTKNRKDCPHNLRRDIPVGWGTFVQKVQLRLDALWAVAGGGAAESAAPPSRAEEGLYRVQVGAFAGRENAEALLARLKADGYEGYIR